MTKRMTKAASLVWLASILPAAVPAQDVLSTRTETQTIIQQAIVPGSDDSGVVADFRAGTMVLRSNRTPAPEAVVEDVTVTTIGFQLPDFEPADLDTRVWHFGLFSDTGSGNGTVYPDYDGYLEFQLTRRPYQPAMEVYVYAIDRFDGSALLFLDLPDLSLNQAVHLLNNVSRAGTMQLAISRGGDPLTVMRQLAPPAPPPAMGEDIHLSLRGDRLDPGSVQEQIFQQTRCDVDEADGVYFIARCY